MAQQQSPPIHESTQVFTLPGSTISRSIYERTKKLESEKDECLNVIAQKLRDRSEEGNQDAAVTAVALMHALYSTETQHLKFQALEIKAYLDRAAILTREYIELQCIARNIQQQEYYKVSLSEAKRYGLL